MQASTAAVSSPTPASTTLLAGRLASLQEYRQSFLKGLVLILMITYLICLVFFGVVAWLSGEWFFVSLTLIDLLGFLCCAFAYYFGKTNRVSLASWLVLGDVVLVLAYITVVLGPNYGIVTGFIVAILISVFLLPLWATIGTLTAGVLLALVSYLASLVGLGPLVTLDSTLSTLVNLTFNLSILLVGSFLVIYLAQQFKRASRVAFEQTEELARALGSIEAKRQVGAEVSQKVVTLSSELNISANQQLSGSQEQAAAITQVTSALTELSQAAREIASSTTRINHMADEVLSSTRLVGQTTLVATEVGSAGQQAMQRTIQLNQEVGEFYHILVQHLTTLHNESNQIGEVIRLMRQLADETHLLALNAAIEAAGAGEYGQRFGVVADAVKELANRSVKASREVAQILAKLEARVEEALGVVEGGQALTETASRVAEQTGTVIEELVCAIKESAAQASTIGQAAVTMSELTRDITSATTQQSSASAQTVETLQEVGVIARQTASTSLQVTTTVDNLNDLSSLLRLTLVAA